MAQRTIVELLDDIDGKPADQTVSFAIDGTSYEIDLTDKNANKLRQDLQPFIAQARKADRAPKRNIRGVRTATSRERSSEIRQWARDHGITINERGRIPANVIEAYESNDPRKAKPGKQIPQTEFSSS
jgi:hypothetical protein